MFGRIEPKKDTFGISGVKATRWAPTIRFCAMCRSETLINKWSALSRVPALQALASQRPTNIHQSPDLEAMEIKGEHREEILAIFAHELRQPLASILFAIQWVAGKSGATGAHP